MTTWRGLTGANPWCGDLPMRAHGRSDALTGQPSRCARGASLLGRPSGLMTDGASARVTP
jgi:hypothetical protein